MSTNYTIACHTCKKKIDLSFQSYSREFIAKVAGDMLMYTHISHHMQIVHDTLGWDADYDSMVSLVDSYEDFGYTEVKMYIDRVTNEEE
ncbi:hypothetical protein DIRTYBETTY_211 [Bacillus phage DirtyBetty]|uniref:Uncharacterized protein n=2 Tax=Wphvirus megatron TaxID=1987728 RepID=A0A1B1PAV5_9CAUD|nr:hypothetical protein QLX47_gp209 [Bacillus phage Eyuki]YP_009285153.1 hypothetical protein BIZ88_gp211 [Bacillus phage DirtyBetty]ALA46517.1 hypothetical protein EYUKI_209 [Bacillus phage Eyuki]ANT41296.1 hypothetical protein DIRTYBETTY_211 [Bacillus phage DirtyBetty]